jgi:NADPH2:quinone reductase
MTSVYIDHITKDDGTYQLDVTPCDLPELDVYDVLIEVVASGVNRADIYQAQGNYPATEGASNILGLEVSGVIVAMGADVRSVSVGDKVCALLQGGGYTSHAIVREHRVLPIPSGVELLDAAGIIETFTTAYLNLFEVACMRPGHVVLVHGGASGVGTAAIQLAKAFGVEVIVTAGNDKKCQLCENLGASLAINYKTDDFVERVKTYTGGKGVDIVLDMVGGDYLQRNMKVLAFGGTLVSIAFIEGAKTEINLAQMLMKNLTLKGSTLRNKGDIEIYELMQSMREIVWPLFESGQVRVIVDSVLPFSEANDAHSRMLGFDHAGKILLRP